MQQLQRFAGLRTIASDLPTVFLARGLADGSFKGPGDNDRDDDNTGPSRGRGRGQLAGFDAFRSGVKPVAPRAQHDQQQAGRAASPTTAKQNSARDEPQQQAPPRRDPRFDRPLPQFSAPISLLKSAAPPRRPPTQQRAARDQDDRPEGFGRSARPAQRPDRQRQQQRQQQFAGRRPPSGPQQGEQRGRGPRRPRRDFDDDSDFTELERRERRLARVKRDDKELLADMGLNPLEEDGLDKMMDDETFDMRAGDDGEGPDMDAADDEALSAAAVIKLIYTPAPTPGVFRSGIPAAVIDDSRGGRETVLTDDEVDEIYFRAVLNRCIDSEALAHIVFAEDLEDSVGPHRAKQRRLWARDEWELRQRQIVAREVETDIYSSRLARFRLLMRGRHVANPEDNTWRSEIDEKRFERSTAILTDKQMHINFTEMPQPRASMFDFNVGAAIEQYREPLMRMLGLHTEEEWQETVDKALMQWRSDAGNAARASMLRTGEHPFATPQDEELLLRTYIGANMEEDHPLQDVADKHIAALTRSPTMTTAAKVKHMHALQSVFNRVTVVEAP